MFCSINSSIIAIVVICDHILFWLVLHDVAYDAAWCGVLKGEEIVLLNSPYPWNTIFILETYAKVVKRSQRHCATTTSATWPSLLELPCIAKHTYTPKALPNIPVSIPPSLARESLQFHYQSSSTSKTHFSRTPKP
ncbi:hypothetical protein VNO77_11443 [Canavalia gladiata]|uniref:Uncharacterized protein n=1 Tax=Canavalia gladiata TaxID=3824 RepID=A0AAN9MGU5_CANGL